MAFMNVSSNARTEYPKYNPKAGWHFKQHLKQTDVPLVQVSGLAHKLLPTQRVCVAHARHGIGC